MKTLKSKAFNQSALFVMMAATIITFSQCGTTSSEPTPESTQEKSGIPLVGKWQMQLSEFSKSFREAYQGSGIAIYFDIAGTKPYELAVCVNCSLTEEELNRNKTGATEVHESCLEAARETFSEEELAQDGGPCGVLDFSAFDPQPEQELTVVYTNDAQTKGVFTGIFGPDQPFDFEIKGDYMELTTQDGPALLQRVH